MLEKPENVCFLAQILFELAQKNDRGGQIPPPPPRLNRFKYTKHVIAKKKTNCYITLMTYFEIFYNTYVLDSL